MSTDHASTLLEYAACQHTCQYCKYLLTKNNFRPASVGVFPLQHHRDGTHDDPQVQPQ